MRRHVVPALAVLVLAGAPSAASAAPLNPPPEAPAPPSNAPPPPAATPGPASIPVPEVAPRAERVARQLRDLDALLDPGDTIAEIEKRLPEFAARIRTQGEITGRQVEAESVGPVLDGLTAQWQATRAQLAEYVNILAERATALERAQKDLNALGERWGRAHTEAQTSRAPAPVIERINGVLTAIAATRSRVQQQRSAILLLQDRVVQQVARCEDMLGWIEAARQASSRRLGDRDGVPLWQAGRLALAISELPDRLRGAISADVAQLRAFARDQRWKIPIHVAFFVALLLVIGAARSRANAWISSGETSAARVRVLERPVSAALVLSLLGSVWLYAPPIPRSVAALAQVLALVPAMRIMRLLVDPRLVTVLYVLAAFLLADLVRHFASVVPLLEQQIFLAETLAAVLLILGWTLVSRLRGSPPPLLPLWLSLLVATLFSIALVAAAGGYMRLALLLGSGVLGNAYLAMVLYAALRACDGLMAFALRVPPLSYLRMVQRHRPRLERRGHGLMRTLAIAAWVFFALRYFGLWTTAVNLTESALTAQLHHGALTVSLGDVLALAVTVGAVLVFSSLLRFVLEEDVYPHLNLGRGLPHALSSMLHYLILLTGFFLALAVLGVDFTKVTILAGALGLGIGFGLQGIVNNFVSGLIVLFERRLDVGDAVQIGDVSGRLQQLGVRACTVRTWEGAEVIVPNASLVSEQVSNWTLSDHSRRIDLPVGVAYRTPPEKVIEILLGVARAHPQVQSHPAPVALFLGFGDSALQFQLYAWTHQFELWVRIRSELSLALYAALREADIEIPFPQREVRLRTAP